MEAWLTQEWQRSSPWQFLLRPLSGLFRLLTAVRCGAYRYGLLKSQSVGVPVIIVGNITVGGTGKTPLVLALVEALATQGMQCGIVTRGYQRRSNANLANVVQVDPTISDAANVSDEAVLLARRSGVPVYAGADRVEAARTLLRHHAKVTVIVSDDGLQHYALQREFEICVIDGARGLGNGRLLPAGPLREPASRLNVVDAIVVNGNYSHSDLPRFATATPAFSMTLANELFINLKSDRRIDVRDALAEFQTMRIYALAGTGHPQRFFSHLTGLGFALTASQPFPDHHQYRAGDMPGMDAQIILMTEKDAVKCGTFVEDRMWFMRVDALLPIEFTDLVLKKLLHLRADHVT